MIFNSGNFGSYGNSGNGSVVFLVTIDLPSFPWSDSVRSKVLP